MGYRTAILVFDEVEVLDFAGPFEVFSVTGRRQAQEPFDVYTVAERIGRVVARNGLSINPRYSNEGNWESASLIEREQTHRGNL